MVLAPWQVRQTRAVRVVPHLYKVAGDGAQLETYAIAPRADHSEVPHRKDMAIATSEISIAAMETTALKIVACFE